jgi:hypothetical protein
MGNNFHNANGWLLVSAEIHWGVPCPPWTGFVPLVEVCVLHPFSYGGNQKPNYLISVAPAVVFQHEPWHQLPHLGFPVNMFFWLNIIMGSHKAPWPKTDVFIGDEMKAITLFGAGATLQAVCTDFGHIPLGIGVNAGTVETTATPWDLWFGFRTILEEVRNTCLLNAALAGALLGLGKLLLPLGKVAISVLKEAVGGGEQITVICFKWAESVGQKLADMVGPNVKIIIADVSDQGVKQALDAIANGEKVLGIGVNSIGDALARLESGFIKLGQAPFPGIAGKIVGALGEIGVKITQMLPGGVPGFVSSALGPIEDAAAAAGATIGGKGDIGVYFCDWLLQSIKDSGLTGAFVHVPTHLDDAGAEAAAKIIAAILKAWGG